MTFLELAWAALGAAMTLVGVACLYLAWKNRTAARPVMIVSGWALIGLSNWPWAVAAGWDRGPALNACLAMLAALAIVLKGLLILPSASGNAPDDAAARASAGEIPWARRIWIVLLAGPVAFASATLVGLAAFMAVSAAEADRLALSAYLAPAVWAVLAVWSAADPNLIRKSIGVVGVGMAGGLALLPLAAS